MHQPGRIAANQEERRQIAAAFTDADVARCYAARPPYAPALYEFLLEQIPARARALDLGCGPGKIAIQLADHIDEVVALDPSAAMIEAGQAADGGRHANIVWATQAAETYESADTFDLVTAGTSVHWFEHEMLFPKLADWTRTFAIVTGDAPAPAPCGDDAWLAFAKHWIARVGGAYDPAASTAQGNRHEAWMDIAGRQRFAFAFQQSIEDFIMCQHSRATWARHVMGDALAAQFDSELDALMRPCAQDGILTLSMVSELTWGAPRRAPR